jgi:hypothetical protein
MNEYIAMKRYIVTVRFIVIEWSAKVQSRVGLNIEMGASTDIAYAFILCFFSLQNQSD